ncbi:glycosyltransferase family 32 protein, partial [Lyophyllum atratum]
MPNPQSGLANVMNNGILPNHSSAVEEKFHRSNASASWTRPLSLPIPGVRTRRLRILVPNVGSFQQLRGTRARRSRGPLLVCFACMALFLTVMIFSRNHASSQWSENWPPSGESSTLVFRKEDLQRIWKWEVASGHFPSSQAIPKQVGLKTAPLNPAIPHQERTYKPSRNRSSMEEQDTDTYGMGPKRVYLDIQSIYPNVAYPPRPMPGSVADMDIIMKHCNFSAAKYVRDCLEVLRTGGGLDNGRRLRRGNTDDWKYIYQETVSTDAEYEITPDTKAASAPRPVVAGDTNKPDPDAGLVKKRGAEWEPQVVLPSPLKYRPSAALKTPCDSENPRVYHMFWTGPFTDKPYLALMSFLFTQNTGMHLKDFPEDSPVCRPQFWMWINPGPAASVPNPSAQRDMFAQLKSSPWASPFLHPRFKEVIQFKLWNTTEQLDGIPEIKDEWRTFKTLFNSGGHVISVPAEKKETTTSATASGNETATATGAGAKKGEEEDMLNRTGSKSSSSYDRLSVILSDMARFILCHRFGGIYLDADTIFLRDWEELWGWKGAFAYRWSRLEKYNTAVLRMHKGSALGTFLFRTALKNGLDFHPMSVSSYTADAYIEPLLLRLPDALFDSAWLNTENFQRDRPPQPYFTEFADFFDTPAQNSAAPQALGFDGFFKGAYSYHFHNFWWKPFDPTRNWPDLGPKFKAGEDQARAALEEAKEKPITTKKEAPVIPPTEKNKADPMADDKRDLDWSAVHKRTFEAYIRGERPNMYGEWLQ